VNGSFPDTQNYLQRVKLSSRTERGISQLLMDHATCPADCGFDGEILGSAQDDKNNPVVSKGPAHNDAVDRRKLINSLTNLEQLEGSPKLRKR
jgi:hypothetical protein